MLRVFAAVGGANTLAGWFPFLKFPSTNMLKQTENRGATTKVNTKIAVIGAGAFGGWTALYLLRRGAKVTLLDAWGPGNSRASSGGETRVIRGTYGPNQSHTKMAARATQLWKENEQRWNQKLMHQTGVLWMVTAGDDHFERESLPLLRDAGIAYQELSVQEMSARWPQINLEAVHWGIYEPQGGFLMARVACQVLAAFKPAARDHDPFQSDWITVWFPRLAAGTR